MADGSRFSLQPTDFPPEPTPATPADGQGRRSAPDAVWAEVRADYLAGRSGPEVCRRHGVRLSTLRDRAAREGWRRADQPWTPPNRLDPWDEGLQLEASVGGDLDEIEPRELSFVANQRMMRAVLRGHAAEALRWSRVREIMKLDAADLERFIEQEEAYEIRHAATVASDASDSSDGILGSVGECPPALD